VLHSILLYFPADTTMPSIIGTGIGWVDLRGD